jgi:Protein of unknown function (DUF3108)
MKSRLLLLLLGAVLLLHWGALNWLSDQIRSPAALVPLAEPMFTRIVEQTKAPEPVTASIAKPPSAAKPKPQKKAAPAPASVVTTEEAVAAASPPAPDSGPPTESPPPNTEPALAAAPDLPVAEPSPLQDTWPPDTRVTYRLTGNYRGELTGGARVQWQQVPAPDGKPESRRYQVRLEMNLSGISIASMTSQGKITEAGLLPEVYEEKLPGAVRRVDFEDAQIRFNNGRVDVRPTTVQDTASQFVDLSHRFATGVETLKAGAEVRVWLARPGGLDFWTYDVMASEILQTPTLGAIEAFHLKPRPLANPRGPIVAEMWFAPSLQYLPVRVRITLGGGSFIDMMVERIEQSERPPAAPPIESKAPDPT